MLPSNALAPDNVKQASNQIISVQQYIIYNITMMIYIRIIFINNIETYATANAWIDR